MELRALIRPAIATIAALTLVGGAVFFTDRPVASASRAVAPSGVRIRVQVVNATATRGLARRATAFLRDRGFDVVEVGTAREARDSTLVIDRSQRPEWAALVARALGASAFVSRPDSSRYVDITVLVGRDWSPPPEPLYP